MLQRNSFSYFLCRFLGGSCIFAALLGVLGVFDAYLLGATRSSVWLYTMIWPYAVQILIGAMLCSIVGTGLFVYPAYGTPMKGQDHELW
jgi:hypothetical protein